ncbi:MAG TPA: PilZ domain-containing protein [Candidatus Goldiibacteriota bacterium]|nr:PilZ domain-containing protein [Candidatus Goldiibacteriota bacterium]
MAEGELYIERRRHKRIDKKLKVHYKVIKAEEEVREIKKNLAKTAGESTDISLGGIKVDGEIPGNVGDVIRIEVLLDGRHEPITTFAEVKWIKGQGKDMSFGLEFLILKEADKLEIEEIILGK